MHLWKFKLSGVPGVCEIEMPKNSKILKLGLQFDQVVLWAACNPKAEKEMYRFVIAFTGDTIVNDDLEYVDTLQIESKERNFQYLVLHVFKERSLFENILNK